MDYNESIIFSTEEKAVKLLHISDLHIGKRLHGYDLIPDQREALSEIVSMAQENKADGVIIAGDVYDKNVPSAEAMSLFSEFIAQLAEIRMPVYIISGNHDNADRISYFSQILSVSGVYVSERFDGRLQTHTVSDEYGELKIHLLPFIKPTHVRPFYPDRKIESYEDAVRAVLENSPIDKNERNVIVTHQFIAGAVVCDSEERTIGTLEDIPASLFADFDYTALGHLHAPQKVMYDTVRYSGTPLKYSFSEASHKKCALLVEVREKGSVEINKLPITQPHDMREIEGSFEELMDMPYSEDYIRAVLTENELLTDLRVSLQTRFPNLMQLVIRREDRDYEETVAELEMTEKKSASELFFDFYTMRNGAFPDEERMELVRSILEELEGENK